MARSRMVDSKQEGWEQAGWLGASRMVGREGLGKFLKYNFFRSCTCLEARGKGAAGWLPTSRMVGREL